MSKVSIRLELNSQRYVVIRLTRDRSYRKISTGVTTIPHHFNVDRHGRWIGKSDSDHLDKNRRIEYALDAARKALDEARRLRAAEPSLDEVAARAVKGASYWDVVDYMEQVSKSYSNWNQLRGWGTAINKVREFIDHEGRKSVDFREVDSLWLGRFDAWMARSGLGAGSRYTQLKRVKTAFNRAIADNVVPAELYPFKRGGFALPKVPPTPKQRLTEKELKSIAKVKLKNKSEADARDTFLAQFFLAGARIEDILRLKVSDVGRDRIEFVMKKTGLSRSYPMSEQLSGLIRSRMDGLGANDYVFPWLKGLESASEDEIKRGVSRKTALVNKMLKKVGEKVGIEKKLTTHIARHSFAQHLVSKDVSIKIVQELLGHSSLAITQKYIDGFNRDKADAVMQSLPTF